MKIPLKEEPEEDEYGLPRLFAEASHLPTTPIKKKKTRGRKSTPTLAKRKWTPY